jgi:hypothetical protein
LTRLKRSNKSRVPSAIGDSSPRGESFDASLECGKEKYGRKEHRCKTMPVFRSPRDRLVRAREAAGSSPVAPIFFAQAHHPEKENNVVMGYETALHLIDVKIKDDSISIVKKALKTKRGRGLTPLVYFLEQAFLPDDGFLCFKPTGDYDSPYVPDQDDGTVTVLVGKWVAFMAPWPNQSCPHPGCGQPIRDLLTEMVPNADQARPDFKAVLGQTPGGAITCPYCQQAVNMTRMASPWCRLRGCRFGTPEPRWSAAPGTMEATRVRRRWPWHPNNGWQKRS